MIRVAKERIFTHSGSGFRNVYKLKFSGKTGSQELVKVGVENWQEAIDSYAPSCDLSVIIARVNAGEVDLLNARPGQYGDFTDLPVGLAEVMQARIDAKKVWDALSDQQRGEFGNDFAEFAGSAGSEEWIDRLGLKKEKVESEVVENADA